MGTAFGERITFLTLNKRVGRRRSLSLSSVSQINSIMASGDQAIQALREALRISPDNLPLRQHLAECLLGMGRPDEAELVFREALAIAPENSRLKTGLAQAFYQQGKNTHCLVLVEDVLKQPDAPAIAAMLHARLLLRPASSTRPARSTGGRSRLMPR